MLIAVTAVPPRPGGCEREGADVGDDLRAPPGCNKTIAPTQLGWAAAATGSPAGPKRLYYTVSAHGRCVVREPPWTMFLHVPRGINMVAFLRTTAAG